MFSFPTPTGRFVRPFTVTLAVLSAGGQSRESTRTVQWKMCLLPPRGGTVIIQNTRYIAEEVLFNPGTRKGRVTLSAQGPADRELLGNTETRTWARSISYAEDAFRLCLGDLWKAEKDYQPADWNYGGRGMTQWFDREGLPSSSVHWHIEGGYMLLSYQLGGDHIQERIAVGRHLRQDKQYQFRCPRCDRFRKVLYGLERFLCASCHGLRYGESSRGQEEELPAIYTQRNPSKAAIEALRNKFTVEHKPLITQSYLRSYKRVSPKAVILYSR